MKGKVSTTGYKRNSPDKDNDLNIINSGHITMAEVLHHVLGIDNQGNAIMMQPGVKNYHFPGDRVLEIPIKQQGGSTLDGVLSSRANAELLDLPNKFEKLKYGKYIADPYKRDYQIKNVFWQLLDDGYKGQEAMAKMQEMGGNASENPRYPVIDLLLDDGISSRGHRYNLLNKDWKYCGCYRYKDPVYGYQWVQNFAN